MWKKKKKYVIDTDEAIRMFEGYGFKAVKFNYYQIRIWPEETNKFYDWYHTTGSFVVTGYRGCAKLGTFTDAEEIAEFINKHLRKKL